MRRGWGQHCHKGAETLNLSEDVGHLSSLSYFMVFYHPVVLLNSCSSFPISTISHCLILVASFVGIEGISLPIYAPPIGGFVPATASGRRLGSASTRLTLHPLSRPNRVVAQPVLLLWANFPTCLGLGHLVAAYQVDLQGRRYTYIIELISISINVYLFKNIHFLFP